MTVLTQDLTILETHGIETERSLGIL